MARSKKRANGEGTFYQLKDRSWVYQITLGKKPDGTPDRKSFKSRTQTECIQRKDTYLAEKARQEAEMQSQLTESEEREAQARRRGHSLESEIVFGNAFLSWLNLYKIPPSVKPATYGSYLDIYSYHFFEHFGEKMLFEITQDCVQKYYLAKQKDGARKDGKPGGLSAKTIRNHHMLVKDFFKYARKKYKLDENPTEDTSRPEVQIVEVRVLSTEETEIFIREVKRETQRIAILFSLFTGVRVGELLALEISDLDLENQTIAVRRNLIRVRTESIDSGNPHIQILNYNPEKRTHLIVQDTPKSKTSNRKIPLSDMLCEMLLRHLYTLQESTWPNPDNLLFPSTRGTHIDPKSYELRLGAVSKRCEIKKVNPHALRHTFATRLVESHIPLTNLRDLLGHASVETTQRYTHKNQDIERAAVSEFTNLLSLSTLTEAPALNGTGKRSKFADIPLPNFAP